MPDRPPAPQSPPAYLRRSYGTFAVLCFSALVVFTGYWVIAAYSFRWIAWPSVQMWKSDPGFRASTSLWQVMGINELPQTALIVTALGLLPCLIFAGVLMWAWPRLDIPVRLRPLMNRGAASSLSLLSAVAITYVVTFVVTVDDPNDPPPFHPGVILIHIILSSLISAVASAWIVYRYLKILERR